VSSAEATKYEYKAVKVDHRSKQQSKELTKLSERGWEIVQIGAPAMQIGYKTVPVQVRRPKR
jgi:hypothetical protein